MKKIFVCSPLRGDRLGNMIRAEKYCREIALKGMLPIAPHAYFPRFLNDDEEKERNLGMHMGILLLRWCDELWYFLGDRTELSQGMLAEIQFASDIRNLIPVCDGVERLRLIK